MSSRRCRRERFEPEQRRLILDCCTALGRYVVPESFVPFLAPRIAGELEVLPGGSDSRARADVTDVLLPACVCVCVER